MKRLIPIAAVAGLELVTLLSPPTAHADPNSRYGRDCHAASLVVGRSECGDFGRWAVPANPRIQIAFGIDVRVFQDHTIALGRPRNPPAARITAPTQPRAPSAVNTGVDLTATAGFFRATGELSRHLYVGLDLGFGVVSVHNAPAPLTFDREDSIYYHAGGVGGVVLHPGALAVRGEVLVGGQSIELGATQFASSRTRQTDTRVIVEPHVAAEVWLGPWTTLGARFGTELLRGQDVVFGLYLNMYSHAFDSSRWRNRLR